MIMLSLLLAYAIQDPWTQKIDYETKAAPLYRIIADLRKKTGLPLKTAGKCSDDIFVLSVHDMTAKELIPKIAEVNDCEWRRSDDNYILIRKQGTETKWLREHEAKERTWILGARDKIKIDSDWSEQKLVDAIKKLREGSEANDGETWEYYYKNRGIEKLAPGDRCTGRIVKNMSADALASVPDDLTIRFGLNPTSLQYPLSPASSDALESYNRESAIHQNVIANSGVGPDNEIGWYFQILRANEPNQKPVTNIVLEVSNQYGGSRSINAMLFDAKGKLISNENRNLSPYSGIYDDPTFKPEKPKVYDPKSPDGQVFHISDLAKSVSALEESRWRKVDGTVDTKAALEYLQDPVKNEPLSLGTSEMWLFYAHTYKKNLIANVSDDSDLGRYFDGSTAGALKNPPFYFRQYDRVENESWVVVKAMDRYVSERAQISRSMLKSLIDEALRSGRISLGTLAQVALNSNDVTFYGVQERMAVAVQKASVGSMMWGNKIDILRLYGTLDFKQRNDLEAGEVTLDYNLLPPDQRAIIDRMVLYSDTRLVKTPADGSKQYEQNEDDFGGGMFYAYGGGGADYQDLPTVAFARGFPSKTLIHLTSGQKPVILGRSTTAQYSFTQSFSPESLGQMLAMAELQRKNGYDENQYWGFSDEFTMATNNALSLSIDFGGKYTCKSVFRLPDTQGTPVFGSFRALPQAIKDAAQKAYLKAMVDYKDMEFGYRTPRRANRKP